MILQNNDLDINKFFIDDHNKITTDISTLKYTPLNREIYFRPSNAPLINVANSKLGSCFTGYSIPTGSYQFTTNGDSSLVDQIYSLTDYQDIVFSEIGKEITKIYNAHAEVTLCYSGGIDSMVLLSYIISLNFLSRTNIVCFKNNTQNTIPEYDKVKSLLEKFDDQFKSITWLTIDISDIIYSFNNQNFEHLKCYATNAVLQKYKNTAFIFGFHGNQILLHKPVFVDEIILQTGSNTGVLEFFKNNNDFYTTSLNNYDVDKEKIGIAHTHMLQKPWALLDGTNNNRVYSPIGTSLTFSSLRQLNFKTVSVDTIAHAQLARNIINLNVGGLLNQFITKEGISDGDILKDTLIPIDQLNNDLLTIPKNLTHNAEGLGYIEHELSLAKKSHFLPINVLVSIKMLHWINQL